MLFLKNAAGALRRNLTDTAHHAFSGPHRGWKIALYVTMLVVPGGSLAALGFIGEKAQAFAHRAGHQRRGCGREDEGAPAIDQKIAHRARAAEQGALAAQGLAARAQGDDVFRPFQIGGEPASARSEHAGCVRLIDQQHRFVSRRDRCQIGERGAVTIHAVQAFDRDPRAASAAAPPPVGNRLIEGARVIMRCRHAFGAGEAHAFMRAGVDQRIVHDQIAALRQRG